MDEQRNYILAIALSLIILLAWQYFVGIPQMEQAEQQQQHVEQQAEQAGRDEVRVPRSGTDETSGPGARSAQQEGSGPAGGVVSREAALQRSQRIEIDTPAIRGSIALTGGRIDDAVLKDYRETVEPTSPNIVLLSPAGSPAPFYADIGWLDVSGNVPVPGPNTTWQAPADARLTPDTPVTLTWDNGQGLVFKREIAVDEAYMFTVTDTVENTTGETVRLDPYGMVSRHGLPQLQNFFILHEGLIGVLGEEGLKEIDYDDLEEGNGQRFSATGGWVGITDKYWATVLVPDQNRAYDADFWSGQADGKTSYQAGVALPAMEIAPGAEGSNTTRVFAGAKRVDLIESYEDLYGIELFDRLIDWGWFYFITKPLFYVIDWFFRMVGNFGVAILLTTVLVKAAFFPLANKSYKSMSGMKKVQPQLMEIRERYKDDKMKQQQLMMELYKKEKINPLSGCLPIVVQIPVFFALYKVLFVTIEMRHAPFFGWIQDLAAPDPTTIFNLFGLIPWDPPSFLMLGVWPLIMGITMWVQMRLNPPPPDPTQAMIFNWMPVVFTFLLATFPAGLVIYWAWNNTLSVIQQYTIMRRQGVEVNLFGNIAATFSSKKRQELHEQQTAKATAEADKHKTAKEEEPAADASGDAKDAEAPSRPSRRKQKQASRKQRGARRPQPAKSPGE